MTEIDKDNIAKEVLERSIEDTLPGIAALRSQ